MHASLCVVLLTSSDPGQLFAPPCCCMDTDRQYTCTYTMLTCVRIVAALLYVERFVAAVQVLYRCYAACSRLLLQWIHSVEEHQLRHYRCASAASPRGCRSHVRGTPQQATRAAWTPVRVRSAASKHRMCRCTRCDWRADQLSCHTVVRHFRPAGLMSELTGHFLQSV